MSSGKNNAAKKGRPKKLRNSVPLPGPWRNSSWVSSFAGKGASPLKYQEVSPSFILRQLLVLVEKGKFIDASQLVNKISMEALKDITEDVPIMAIIESIPKSLVLLESLYSRLFISDADNFPMEQFQVEVMVFHIVRYLSMPQSSAEYKYPKPEDAKKSIINILRIVLHVNPDLVRTLYKRKKIMDTALQGIGEHGLIEVNGSLINLHDALKLEIGNTITSYKGAASTLDQHSLSHGKPIKLNGEKKSGQRLNHQALTKLNENQIKGRLFKNKALLNAIEPPSNSQLPGLIVTLKNRIEYDKSALLAFGKLKSEIKTFSSQTKVVPLLAQYSRSLHTVMDILKDLLDEHCGSDKSSYSTLGYHSDEDMLSVQEMADEDDEASTSTSTQPETEENVEDKIQARVDPIEKILGPTNEGERQERMSLPGNETPEKRSRWWKHHRRSQSLDNGSTGRATKRSASSDRDRSRSRSGSVDRSAITRPRRQSVEDSEDFQRMMSRIRDMSASSPAVGRRQLERRGISQPRSRDSSISPAALRRHFFGGGEQTPSITSQTEDSKDDDPDPLYATITPKTRRLSKGEGSETSKRLEEVSKERDRLAEREKKLMQENESLRERLSMVTIAMEKMKDERKDSANDEVFLPFEPTVIIIEQAPRDLAAEIPETYPEEESTTSKADGSISQGGAPLASPEILSPPESFSDLEDVSTPAPDAVEETVPPPEPFQSKKKASSFVEQQKAILIERAEMLRRSGTKGHHHPQEELPESSVQQRTATLERQLKASHQDPDPVQVSKGPLGSLQQPNQPSSVEEPAEESTHEAPVKDETSTEVQPDKQPLLSDDSQDLSTKQDTNDDELQEAPTQPMPTIDDKTSPVTQTHTLASLQQPLTDSKPTEPAPTNKPLVLQPSSSETQKLAEVRHQTIKQEPPSPRKSKTATFSNQLHLAPIPETSSPADKPKSANFVSQKMSNNGSKQNPQSTTGKNRTKKVEDKVSHATRHLPKNYIRNVSEDLLYEYDKLYTEQRAVAWTSLTIPAEDKDVVLFSVIVSAQTTIHELHMAKARMLQIPITDDEESVSSYTMDIPPDNRSQDELLEHLRRMGDGFDLQPMITDVLDQLFEVSDHQLLQDSVPLKKFVTSCVSLAWRLSILASPFIIDFELRSFDPAVHQRVPSANRKSVRVKEHIWPALLESTKGMCVYKGVVLT